jgi:hypothetical protein
MCGPDGDDFAEEVGEIAEQWLRNKRLGEPLRLPPFCYLEQIQDVRVEVIKSDVSGVDCRFRLVVGADGRWLSPRRGRRSPF